MLVNTHWLIGQIVYRHLKKHQYPVDRISFEYGNIKPDLDVELRRKRHTFDKDVEYIFEKIENLIQENMTRNAFSRELGVVCHFVSDFFCTFHRKEFIDKSFFYHFMYELRLHFRLRQILGGKLLIWSGKSAVYSIKDLKTMIIEMHCEYLAKESTVNNDIIYAVTCLESVCRKIVEEYTLRTQVGLLEHISA